ncbi:MAG: (Fe-S)-binding protein, partial [Elusimicrobiota bacterium]|nr:(Fe-S)-binding protein [Elusimicrobiota bacterium]
MNLTGAREAQKSFSLICASKRDAVGKCFFNPLKGFLSIYDSARLCSRCGACAQACPSYKVLKGEVFSPRGRNQLLRFIL